jgi:hypothetical protein
VDLVVVWALGEIGRYPHPHVNEIQNPQHLSMFWVKVCEEEKEEDEERRSSNKYETLR